MIKKIGLLLLLGALVSTSLKSMHTHYNIPGPSTNTQQEKVIRIWHKERVIPIKKAKVSYNIVKIWKQKKCMKHTISRGIAKIAIPWKWKRNRKSLLHPSKISILLATLSNIHKLKLDVSTGKYDTWETHPDCPTPSTPPFCTPETPPFCSISLTEGNPPFCSLESYTS